jgi:hypothetical protein
MLPVSQAFRPVYPFEIEYEYEFPETKIKVELEKGNIENAVKLFQELPSVCYYRLTNSDIKKIFTAQLDKGDFLEALNTAHSTYRRSRFIKIAEKLKTAKLDPETLAKVENAADQLLGSFRKIILEALLAVYQTLGNKEAITRLEGKLSEIKDTEERIQQLAICLLGSIVFYAATTVLASTYYDFCILLNRSSYACHMNRDLELLSAAGSTLFLAGAMQFPELRKIPNVLGIVSGVAASSAGLSALPAVATGLGTALVTRIPFVQNTAKKIAVGSINAATYTANKTAQVANFVFEKSIYTVNKAAQAANYVFEKSFKTINYVSEKTFQAIDKGVSLSRKALLLGVETTGKVISKVSSGLDYLASFAS